MTLTPTIAGVAQIRRAIIDPDNDIPPLESIGFDPEADRSVGRSSARRLEMLA